MCLVSSPVLGNQEAQTRHECKEAVNIDAPHLEGQARRQQRQATSAFERSARQAQVQAGEAHFPEKRHFQLNDTSEKLTPYSQRNAEIHGFIRWTHRISKEIIAKTPTVTVKYRQSPFCNVQSHIKKGLILVP